MKRGKLILVIGPSGSGKGTMLRYAREKLPQLARSVSCTTRAMRPGETDGVEYHFLTEEIFRERIEKGEFLEWATYGKNLYGTPKSEILPRLEAGISIELEIEVQGARIVRETLAPEDVFSIYIDAGDWETLEARIRARAPMTDEDIANRKAHFEDERSYMQEADVVIENHDGQMEEAKEAFVAAIARAIEA